MPAVSISVLQGNRPKGIYLEVLAHDLMGLVGLKSGQQSGLGMQVAFHPTVFVGFFFHTCIECVLSILNHFILSYSSPTPPSGPFLPTNPPLISIMTY